MAKFNKVLLLGNLTRDPEIRYIASGQAVTTFGLAVNEKYGKGEDAKESILFIDITSWGKSAESCAEFLKKGSPVFIEGRLRLENWDDKETGQKRSKVSVTAQSVQFLSSGEKKESEAQAQDDLEIPF